MNLFICPKCQTEQHTREDEPLFLSFYEDHDCEWVQVLNVDPRGPTMPEVNELFEEAVGGI